MSFFRRLLGKKNQTREGEPEGVHLAFVLLPEEHLPSAEKIVACYKAFVPAGESICRHQDAENDNASEQVLSFDFNSEGSALVALVPAAVPNREADEGTQFSVSSLGTDWTLPEHEAHLVVTTPPSSSLSKVEQLSRFTSLLAAVAKASNAVGIYWGSAGATHDADFVTSQKPGGF